MALEFFQSGVRNCKVGIVPTYIPCERLAPGKQPRVHTYIGNVLRGVRGDEKVGLFLRTLIDIVYRSISRAKLLRTSHEGKGEKFCFALQ